MQTESTVLILGLILQLIVTLGSLYMFRRRFPLELMEKTAEARHDVSSANMTDFQMKDSAIQAYDRVFQTLISRDVLVAELNRDVHTLKLDLETANDTIKRLGEKLKEANERADRNEKRADSLQDQLDTEIRKRIAAEDERERASDENAAEIVRLSGIIDKLQPKVRSPKTPKGDLS